MIVQSWLARAAARRPVHTAVEAGDTRLSYVQLLAAAQAGAVTLAARGVRSGNEVAIALVPGADFAVALHSCWLLGAVAVPLDMRQSETELRAAVRGASAVIAEPLPATARACQAEGCGLDGMLEHDLGATAVVIRTSGTTSEPKRVELSFGNLLWSALGSGVALGTDPRERWLCTLPLCHVGGLSILVRSVIFATTAVIHERFETERAVGAIMEEEMTVVSVVATTLARLLDAGLSHPPKLRCALAGGGPVPEALLERAVAAGVPVCQTYGLTETCSQASTVPLAALGGAEAAVLEGAAGAAPGGDERLESMAAGARRRPRGGVARLGAGRPLFCTRIQMAGDGEILVAGPTVAAGAEARDGWLHTGDIGRIDAEGNLHVTGRKAETIISGGENVAPAEVEAALEAHPDVVEAAVVARPHPDWGEAVMAIVVPRPGATPTLAVLREHCTPRLAPYKIPKDLILVSEPLPRTPSGKLLRRKLQ